MRRLTSAFILLCVAAGLVACGDTGDHFGEFRQQTPSPVQVDSLTLNMPIIPGPNVASGKFLLEVTAYNAGQAIAYQTNLTDPIKISTNYPGYVQFQSPTGPSSTRYNSLNLAAAPPPITVYYTRPPVALCHSSAPQVFITALNHTAVPVTTDINLTGCSSGPSPSPTPTGKPTGKPTHSPSPSPTPSATPTPTPPPTVTRLTLSMPATPNPLSPGTFTLVVGAFGPTGLAIPSGTLLSSPISLTSSSTCSIGFIPPTGGSAANNLVLDNAPGSIAITYTPPSSTCTPPSQIQINAYSSTAKPDLASFSILGGTATVGSITLSMLANPNTKSEGVYPFFVTAKDTSGNLIPFGETLLNPITLSSNASCATGFGVSSNPDTFTGTLTISSTQTQVYMGFNPGPSCIPPTGYTVTVTGIATGVTAATYSFPY